MSLIETRNLTIGVDRNIVLEDINLQINDGDLIFLTGTNGSGKSTLVKTILGLSPIISGDILLDKKKWNQRFITEKIGYLPQYTELDKNFPISVKELIELSCRDDSCDLDTEKHLKYLSSTNLVDRTISELSGGELQRVMIARALVNSPRIIIYDEPTNNLDKDTVKNYEKLVRRLQGEKKTQIIITHDHEFAHRFDDKKELLVENKKIKEVHHD